MKKAVNKIYVLHYKNGNILDLPPFYSHLMAGNALLQGQTEMQGDDSDENISAKNRYYSELTGIYWIWKNTQNEITGVCHYRRFFIAQSEPLLYRVKRWLYVSKELHRKHYGLIYTSNVPIFKERILTESEACELLKHYDAILPIARKLKQTVEIQYARRQDADDLILLRKIINEKQPEYIGTFDKVLQTKRLYANNMFGLKKELFQEFMQWWFELLFEFEKRIDLQKKIGYQQRVLGFIAERLLTLWFVHKQLNIAELPVIYFNKFKEVEEYDI